MLEGWEGAFGTEASERVDKFGLMIDAKREIFLMTNFDKIFIFTKSSVFAETANGFKGFWGAAHENADGHRRFDDSGSFKGEINHGGIGVISWFVDVRN